MLIDILSSLVTVKELVPKEIWFGVKLFGKVIITVPNWFNLPRFRS